MKNKITPKAIRDGAMMIALTVIFMLIGLYVPLLSVLGMFLSGIPLAVLYTKDGITVSIYAVFISILIMFAFTADILSVFILIAAYTVPGLVSGICLRKNADLFSAVVFTGTAFFVGLLFEIIFIKLFMGGIENMFDELFLTVQKTTEELMKNTAGGVGEIDKVITLLKDTIKLYFPSMLIISSLFFGYIMYTISTFILKRLRLYNGEITPFYMIKAPRSMCYMTLLIYIIGLFFKDRGMISAALMNIVLILYILIAFCGLSFIDFKFRKRIKQGYVRAILYVVLLLVGGVIVPFIFNICLLIGFFDSTRNFRGIKEISEVNEEDK